MIINIVISNVRWYAQLSQNTISVYNNVINSLRVIQTFLLNINWKADSIFTQYIYMSLSFWEQCALDIETRKCGF